MADKRAARALERDPGAGARARRSTSFLRDLCTIAELEAMAHRWAVAQLLDAGLPYTEVARRTHASTTTVTRVAHWLRHGEGRLPAGARPDGGGSDRPPEDRRPGQGAPARAVGLAARGCGSRPRAARRARACLPLPQRARRRAARARRRHPRVRPGRRRRLRHHRPGPRRRARRPGRGAARARLRLLPSRGRGARGVELHDRFATSPGRPSRPSIPRSPAGCCRSRSTLVDVTGSVEIAPRLGLADAIVDLVSSGNTLRTNGLRSLGALFSSQAVLIGRAGAETEQARLDDARRRRGARAPLPDVQRARRRASRRSARSSARTRRASCRSPRRAWSPCTRSCPPRRCGGSCRSSSEAGASSILVVPVERMAR